MTVLKRCERRRKQVKREREKIRREKGRKKARDILEKRVQYNKWEREWEKDKK